VHLLTTDVAAVLEEFRGDLDAVLLDVDNGPAALCHPGNTRLYGPGGLTAVFRALRPGGCLAIWSAWEDAELEARMEAAGFRTDVRAVSPHDGVGSLMHTIFVGRRAPDEDPS
jgi:spermidine synthase